MRAPSRIRSRVEEGPRGDGMPPAPGRSQRVVAGVVAFAVFGAAAWFAAGGFGHGSPPLGASDAVVLRLAAGANDPQMSLRFAGQNAGASVQSYCWNQENGAQKCADAVLPPPFGPRDFLEVPAGTPFMVENPDGADPVELRVSPGDDPSVPGSATTVKQLGSLDPGRYVLSVTASWEGRGDHITFHFALEVLSPSSPPPAGELLATLDAPDDGTMPALTLAYRGTEHGFFAQGGGWPGVDGFRMPLLSFEPTIAPGTTLRVDGDAADVRAWVEVVGPEGSLSGEKDPLELAAGSATLPSVEGGYQLELRGSWARGTAAFFVRIQIGEARSPGASPLPPVERGIVPDVIGVGEGDASKLLSQAGFESVSEYAPTPGVAAGIVVSVDPAPGTPLEGGWTVRLIVSGTTVALDGYLTPLACSSEDMMPFAIVGGVDEPAGADSIRVNVDGVVPSDAVVQFRFDQGQDPGRGLWAVTRGKNVLAVIYVPSLEGVACRGSGIGGV